MDGWKRREAKGKKNFHELRVFRMEEEMKML
jgi:hypothetical protein